MKENELETITYQGKEYVTVNTRLKYFRENLPGWGLVTEILFHSSKELIYVTGEDKPRIKDAEICIIAKIFNPEGSLVATGMALEKENSSFVNKTSYVENCETSAWGRALANLGIGIDKSVASADELVTALKNQ
jgi:hypothetical protein